VVNNAVALQAWGPEAFHGNRSQTLGEPGLIIGIYLSRHKIRSVHLCPDSDAGSDTDPSDSDSDTDPSVSGSDSDTGNVSSNST
jgi:hypothetical protein